MHHHLESDCISSNISVQSHVHLGLSKEYQGSFLGPCHWCPDDFLRKLRAEIVIPTKNLGKGIVTWRYAYPPEVQQLAPESHGGWKTIRLSYWVSVTFQG